MSKVTINLDVGDFDVPARLPITAGSGVCPGAECGGLWLDLGKLSDIELLDMCNRFREKVMKMAEIQRKRLEGNK